MEKNNFKPFERVLVRYDKNDIWRANLYSHYDEKMQLHICSYSLWKCCIPYEGNEHLLGTTDCPKPKRWRAKRGELLYFVNAIGEVSSTHDVDTDADNNLFNIGNYFRTKEEAQAMAKKFKDLFK